MQVLCALSWRFFDVFRHPWLLPLQVLLSSQLLQMVGTAGLLLLNRSQRELSSFQPLILRHRSRRSEVSYPEYTRRSVMQSFERVCDCLIYEVVAELPNTCVMPFAEVGKKKNMLEYDTKGGNMSRLVVATGRRVFASVAPCCGRHHGRLRDLRDQHC